MKLFALIVAGGSGKRMGSVIPKQFMELAGRPVLMHTIERFYNFNTAIRIITVLPEDQFGQWEQLQLKHSFKVPHILVPGGDQRYYSVKNGLREVEDDSIVAVHDGVRPLVSTDTIRRCFNMAEKQGNAIPVISPSDSVRTLTGQGNTPISRESLRIIQTPQVFHSNLLKKAYCQDYSPDITDDAMLLEKTGIAINLVEGNRENIKVTNPEDLIIAEALIHLIS